MVYQVKCFSKVKQYDAIDVTAINGCCRHVDHSQQSCLARESWPKPWLCGKQEAVLSEIYLQGIVNMPFNDFANTTQDGYRVIVAAFWLVSRFVDWANPSMFPSRWHDSRPQTSRFIIHVSGAAMWLAVILMSFALMPSAPVALLGCVDSLCSTYSWVTSEMTNLVFRASFDLTCWSRVWKLCCCSWLSQDMQVSAMVEHNWLNVCALSMGSVINIDVTWLDRFGHRLRTVVPWVYFPEARPQSSGVVAVFFYDIPVVDCLCLFYHLHYLVVT